MKTTARILIGWIAVACCLSAASATAEDRLTMLRPGTTATNAATAETEAGKRQQVDDLVRRARQAIAENQLDVAEQLVRQAEAIDVKYTALDHFRDNPQKVRQALEQKRGSKGASPRLPSQLFSQLSLKKKEVPSADPFNRYDAERAAAGVGDAKVVAKSYLLNARRDLAQNNLAGAAHWHRMAVSQGATFEPQEDSPEKLAVDIRSRGGQIDESVAAGADATQVTPLPRVGDSTAKRFENPFGRSVDMTPPMGDDLQLPPALARDRQYPSTSKFAGTPGTDAVDPLSEARRALAVGDVGRANDLVREAKQTPYQYGSASDSPEKVSAAIRKYEELAVQPKTSEIYRRNYARMLMEQAEALLSQGDYEQAEQLAQRAAQQNVSFGSLGKRPQDVLDRIANARRQQGPGSEAGFAMAESSSNTVGASMAARQQAMTLTSQARAALNSGRLDEAEQLARQADQLRVPDQAFGPRDDRPGLVLMDIRMRRQQGGGVMPASASAVSPATGAGNLASTASQALYNPGNDPTRNLPAQHQVPTLANPETSPPRQLSFGQGTPTPAPSRPAPMGASPVQGGNGAYALFRQGEEALTAHDTQRAFGLFQQAAARMNELDPVSAQRLQGYLQMLTPRSQAPQTASAQPTMVDDAAAKQQILARQLGAEVAHSASQARGMQEKDPKGAVALLKQARQKVESSGLEPTSQQQLLRRIDRHIADTEQFIEQNRPRIELEERNQQVRDEMERDQRVNLEIQEKIALLIDDFNRKVDEQRYAEAEVLAKRAAELDADNPVVRQVVWTAKLLRRERANAALQAEKEEGFITQLGNVDEASVPFDDNNPLEFGHDAKGWAELTRARARFLERGRNRTEREIQIENKLKTPVSLSFRNRPLGEVLDYLARVTEVNMHLDPQGMAEEGVSSDTPVTIEVRHEIMLKSALNLVLEPLHLSYVVKDEVLKITSEQLRDGEVFTATYNVADLVIPIPNFVPTPRMGLQGALHDALGMVGFGGGVGANFGGSGPMAVLASKDGGKGSASINPALLAQMGNANATGGTGSPSMPMGFGPGGAGGGAQADFDSLIELITSTIQPTTWDEVGGPGSIAPFETNLSIVVSQTQEVHEEIVDLLEQLRRLQDLQVTIEVRFITLNDNFFERIGVDFDFDIDDNIDRPYQVFGRADPNTSTTYSPGPFNVGTGPARNVMDTDNDQSVTVGMSAPGVFSADLDIPFTQNSYSLAVPQFGGFDASAGASLGFAILSDIEAYFFINAAQGDKRSNVLQAPKVTLFNGQQAFVSDTSQSPFVISVIPVVGDFAAAQQPVIVVLSEGTFMTVQAVVSNDRRFVRLTVVPFFSEIGDVNTFTFEGEQTTTVDTTREGLIPGDNGDDQWNNNVDNTTTTTQGTTVQLPTFSFVTVTTTVSVPDGGTVLLGGIKRLSEGRNEFGTPILNKIPYINRLFKNVGIGRETQSLMMMVTPRIIIQEEEEERLGISSGP